MAWRTLPAGSEAPETLLLSPLAGRGPPTPGHTGSGALESGLEGADVSNCFSLSALSISKFSAGLPSASDPHLPSLLCVCVAGGTRAVYFEELWACLDATEVCRGDCSSRRCPRA